MYLLLSVGPYPNSALSAGELALIAVVPVLALAAWLILVFAADRQQRHGAAGKTSLLRHPGASLLRHPGAREHERGHPERKAA
jgi:hypothetical protein